MIDLQWRDIPFGDGTICTALRQEEADELKRLAKDKHILEIGSAHGYSAIIMAQAGGIITAVDNHYGNTWLGDTLGIMRKNVEASGMTERIRIIAEDSTTYLPTAVKRGLFFDMVFLDGAENYKQLMFDIKWGVQLLSKGGLFVCHDYDHALYPDKKIALDECFPQGPDKLVVTLFEVTP